MSNAQTAAKAAPSAVVSRETVFGGPVVCLAIPAKVVTGVYWSEHGPQSFIRFARWVKADGKSGAVNIFVHDNNPLQHCGTTVLAIARIIKKTFADGRAFLHIDLYPVPPRLVPTHRLVVVPKACDLLPEEGWRIFETPAPLQGAIVILDPDQKVRFKEPHAKLAMVPKSVPAPKPKVKVPNPEAGGDRKLAQLLEVGWLI